MLGALQLQKIPPGDGVVVVASILLSFGLGAEQLGANSEGLMTSHQVTVPGL